MVTDKLQMGQLRLLEQMMKMTEEIRELKRLILTMQKTYDKNNVRWID